MDRIGHFSSTRTSLKVVIPIFTPMRRMNIDTNAERKIAVPVAEIGSNLNTAAIGVALVAIGAPLTTSWSRCGMAKLNTSQ